MVWAVNVRYQNAMALPKKVMVSLIALLLISSLGFAWAEVTHFHTFHHFVGYGVHMDVALGNSDIGRRDTYYVRVWNVSFRTLDIEGSKLPGGFVGEGTLYHFDIQRWNESTRSWDSLKGADNWLPTPFAADREVFNPEVTHIRPFTTRVVGSVYKDWVTTGDPIRIAVHTSLHLPPTQQRILYTGTFVLKRFR